MPQVLLVNPSPRKGAAKKGKATMAKKARTAAQKRATAKLVALNKARRSGSVSRAKPARRKARKVTRRSNPSTVEVTMASKRSPARRKARRSTKTAASGAGRVLRYRRRNPIGGGMGEFVSGQLIPSAIGGGGALLLDVAYALLPIPVSLKAGPLAPVVKIAGAVGIGMLANMVTSKKTANQIAAGALTVTMYQIARGMIGKLLPAGSIPGLNAPEVYNDLPYVGEYVGDAPMELLPDGTVGEYVGGDDDDGMGYISSGMQVGGYETGVYR